MKKKSVTTVEIGVVPKIVVAETEAKKKNQHRKKTERKYIFLSWMLAPDTVF